MLTKKYHHEGAARKKCKYSFSVGGQEKKEDLRYFYCARYLIAPWPVRVWYFNFAHGKYCDFGQNYNEEGEYAVWRVYVDAD